jgi:hypothetical protein
VAAACIAHNIGGLRLFELTTKDLVEKLGLELDGEVCTTPSHGGCETGATQMIVRRKIEHAIAKLKDPYLQRKVVCVQNTQEHNHTQAQRHFLFPLLNHQKPCNRNALVGA